MSTITFEQFKSKTTSFIEFISSRENEEPPEIQIIDIERVDKEGAATEFSPKRKSVTKPSQKYSDYYDETFDHFKELVKDSAERAELDILTLTENFGRGAWAVMDYEGDFDYSDETIQAVWNDHFQRESASEYRYTVVIPLINLVGDVDSMNLNSSESDVQPHEQNRFVVESISITKAPEEILGAIMTYEGYGAHGDIGIRPDALNYTLPQYLLQINFCSNVWTSFGLESVRTGVGAVSKPLSEKAERLGDRVITGLRLYDPESEPGSGLAYIVYDDWRTYREDINSTDIYRSWRAEYTPTLSDPQQKGSNFALLQSNMDEVSEFWESHQRALVRNEYDEALYRFNQLFQGKSDRDDLVDAAIAFESLLTTGVDWGSITTTMALHGSVLIEEKCSHDREELWTFFKNMYDARGQVVHEGKRWDEISDNIDFEIHSEDSPPIQDYVGLVRVTLARTILAYMEQYIDSGSSVGKINQDIFRALRHCEYPES